MPDDNPVSEALRRLREETEVRRLEEEYPLVSRCVLGIENEPRSELERLEEALARMRRLHRPSAIQRLYATPRTDEDTQPVPHKPARSKKRRPKGGHSPGRPPGANQFSREQCDDLAREALNLRAATPPRPWREIKDELGVPEKTLRRYIRHLKAREGQ